MELSIDDRNTLRELGTRYMTYALSEKNAEKRQLWRALNDGTMLKPMVAIDQMPWNELDVDGFLNCTVADPYFRRVEWKLRSEIYKWERLPADMVLNPYILLPRPVGNTGYGLHAEHEALAVTDATSSVVSQRYVNQFREPEDIEKIKTPAVSIDRAAEAELAALAQDVFDGIAPVRMQGIILHLGFWDFIAQWMGVENCYIELMDRPEMMHAIMEKLTVATLDEIGQINALGLYDVNTNSCHCSYTFSDQLPSVDCDRDDPTSRDGWAFGMAQLFTSVSPAITAEFEVPYMQRIFPHFGAIYYGCCDRLDDRLDVICKMPNIRGRRTRRSAPHDPRRPEARPPPGADTERYQHGKVRAGAALALGGDRGGRDVQGARAGLVIQLLFVFANLYFFVPDPALHGAEDVGAEHFVVHRELAKKLLHAGAFAVVVRGAGIVHDRCAGEARVLTDLPFLDEQKRPDDVHARAFQPGVRFEAEEAPLEKQAEHGGLDHVVLVVGQRHDVAAQGGGGGVEGAAAEVRAEGAGVRLFPDVKNDLGDPGVNDLQRYAEAVAELADRGVVNALEPQRYVHRPQFETLRVKTF